MISAADLLKLGGESLTTAPAYIKIYDSRDMKERTFEKRMAEKLSGSNALGMNIPGSNVLNGAMDKLKDQAMNTAKSAISQVAGDGLLGTLGNMVGSKLGIGSLQNDKYNKIFKVQFNPSSLQLSSQGGGEVVQKSSIAGSKKATSIEMGVTSPHVELSVQLIFDSLTANYKAFAADLANVSSTNLINEATDLAGDLLATKVLGGNGGIGVQAAVEGFIAAMRNEYTREVAFEWGDLYYMGEFKSVNATYTMFDSVGRPVRAKVNMAIYLEDEKVTNSDLGIWETAYDTVFENGSINLGGTAIGNAAKSIINI